MRYNSGQHRHYHYRHLLEAEEEEGVKGEEASQVPTRGSEEKKEKIVPISHINITPQLTNFHDFVGDI